MPIETSVNKQLSGFTIHETNPVMLRLISCSGIPPFFGLGTNIYLMGGVDSYHIETKLLESGIHTREFQGRGYVTRRIFGYLGGFEMLTFNILSWNGWEQLYCQPIHEDKVYIQTGKWTIMQEKEFMSKSTRKSN